MSLSEVKGFPVDNFKNTLFLWPLSLESLSPYNLGNFKKKLDFHLRHNYIFSEYNTKKRSYFNFVVKIEGSFHNKLRSLQALIILDPSTP